jgi:hypothetical protein
MQQDNSIAQTQSQGLVDSSSAQALVFCIHNPLDIKSLKFNDLGISVAIPSEDTPTYQHGRKYENHFRTPATPPGESTGTDQGKRPPLLDYDRLLLHSFIESHIGPFMRHLDDLDIDPVEAESILEALKS